MAQLLDPINGVKNTSTHVESPRCKLTQLMTTGLCKYFESAQQFDSANIESSHLFNIEFIRKIDGTGKSSHLISSHRDWTVFTVTRVNISLWNIIIWYYNIYSILKTLLIEILVFLLTVSKVTYMTGSARNVIWCQEDICSLQTLQRHYNDTLLRMKYNLHKAWRYNISCLLGLHNSISRKQRYLTRHCLRRENRHDVKRRC
jgi:hypothetical protein